ncbi:thiamine phosphate synthase [Nocardia vaccinii]|uniref:thiamine phosphate synthase n=1 Tax=Nocardia vaccinii TaxID=1822 RepID=UPI000829DF08|nr:thiamine phosphate synthase [Nocardia vaccinii]
MQPSHQFRPVAPRERLATARLYLCTDARREKGDLAAFAEAALAGGVDIIQLRDKGSAGEKQFGPLEARAELGALAALEAAARRHGALVAVNDRADVAFAAGADVLHLGQDDLPPWYARRILGPDVVIGRSTHDPSQASKATTEEHIDYFCTGPVWTTPTKPGRSAAGLDLVRSAAEAEPARPWFAIGGIDAARLPEVLDAGATRIVVVRAITEAEDPEAAARTLKSRLEENAPA